MHIFRRTLAYRTTIIGFALIVWLVALPVFAQITQTCGVGQKCLQNPLRFPSIEKFIAGLLQAIVMIALPIITLFIVYAGFKYISARGKPDKLSESNKNFVYVVIGTILILSAWVLATLIGGTVTQLLGT